MTLAIDHHVEQIVAGLEALSAVMMEPDTLQLASTHQAIERLHAALPMVGNVNAAFAYICERDGAGKLVGANHAVEYLAQRLSMGRAEAFGHLEHGKLLFGAADVPEPEPSPEKTREEQEREEAERKRRAEEAAAAKERARKAAQQKKATEEKRRIIRNALRDLNEHAKPGREQIYADAMEQADGMSPESLRKYVADQVRRANRNGRDLSDKKDPLAAFKKRSISFTDPDTDGGSYARIYLDAASRAKLEAALAGADSPGSNLPDGAPDHRTKRQRRFDQLMALVDAYSRNRTLRQGGVGTVIVAMTLEDLMNATPDTEFETNTSVSLTALDILRLGLAGDSFALQLDSATGVPLSMGRARFASIEQRIALLAMQSVCAWNGCTKPGVELEAHHLESFLRGGLTSIDNLVLLCREHHRCNDDTRTGAGGKGYFNKDPETGDVHYVPGDGGPPRPTDTFQYKQSPGQRLAARARSRHAGNASRAPDPALFEPPDG